MEDIIQVTINIQRKLMVVGAAGAGKSSFILQFSRRYFSEGERPMIEETKARASTDEMFMVVDILNPKGFHFENEINLTANHAQFVDQVHMLIVVYDITSRPSFERVADYWHKATKLIGKTSNTKPAALLIGNKLDLADQRAVKTEEGEQLARELGMMFGEVSSKIKGGVEEVMEKALSEIVVVNPRARALKPVIKVTPSCLSDRTSPLLKSPIFSDAALTLNEHKWNVHKFILSARSPVFFEIFKDASISEVPIKGDNISPEAVTAMIHFMYTALVDFSPKIASQVVSLSAEYKIDVLGDIAADIAKKGSYEPTSQSLAARASDLSQDLLKFSSKRFEQDTHPGFDVALKVDHQKPVLTSRALLARNSKYFMDLFEKNHNYEVQLDVPNLNAGTMRRIIDWICGNEWFSSMQSDIEMINMAVKFNLHKSIIDKLEQSIGKHVISYGIPAADRVALLNQNIAEQVKAVTEWQTALQYEEIMIKQPDVLKQINAKSRKNIQSLADQMGTLVKDDNKSASLRIDWICVFIFAILFSSAFCATSKKSSYVTKQVIISDIINGYTIQVADIETQEEDTVILDGIVLTINPDDAYIWMSTNFIEQEAELRILQNNVKRLFIEGLDIRQILIDNGVASVKQTNSKQQKKDIGLPEKGVFSADLIGFLFAASILYGFFKFQRRPEQQPAAGPNYLQSLNTEHGVAKSKLKWLLAYVGIGVASFVACVAYTFYQLYQNKIVKARTAA